MVEEVYPHAHYGQGGVYPEEPEGVDWMDFICDCHFDEV